MPCAVLLVRPRWPSHLLRTMWPGNGHYLSFKFNYNYFTISILSLPFPASLRQCPSCSSSYNEGELIIQCQQFAQWLHAACDLIRNEREAEFCAEDGYTCVLCRPPDQQPPHLHPSNASATALALAPPPSVSVQSTSNLSGSRQNRLSSSATPPPNPVPGLQEFTVGSLINGSSNSNRPKSSASSSSQFVVDGVSLSE